MLTANMCDLNHRNAANGKQPGVCVNLGVGCVRIRWMKPLLDLALLEFQLFDIWIMEFD